MFMEEQARATFVLAAATLTAAQMRNTHTQGAPHSDADAVEHMLDILREMEEQGIIPAGVDKAKPEYSDPMPIAFS